MSVATDSYEGSGVLVAANCRDETEWVMDSGCSFHMCPNKHWFYDYQLFDGGQVVMGNNATCTVVGIGSIKLKLNDGTEKILTKVRHVPDLKRNLISLGTLEEAGFSFKAESSMLKVMKGVRVVMKGNRKNGLYVLKGCAVTGISSSVSKTNVSKSSLWHQRLGHISERGLQELEKQGLLCGDKVEGLEFCEHCIYGKQTRVKFNTGIHKTKGKLDYIHSDLWGPSKVPSHGGNRYFITFIDDFSRKVWIYLVKTKDEAFNTFVQWKTRVENQCDKRIKSSKN